MSLLLVRAKNQITLPREAMECLKVASPAHIECQVTEEGVLLRSVNGTSDATARLAKLRRLSKDRVGGFKDAKAVDAYIDNLRRE